MPESIAKMVLDGSLVRYSEIFGSKDTDKFSFEFGQTERYIIDDQYCSNPKCLCNEAVLTFFRIDTSKTTQEPEFISRMSLKNFKYEIEQRNCNISRVADIIKYVQHSRLEIFGIIKNRYSEMKNAGREIIKKYDSEVTKEEQPKVKAGRNDPCPCGSGKKGSFNDTRGLN